MARFKYKDEYDTRAFAPIYKGGEVNFVMLSRALGIDVELASDMLSRSASPEELGDTLDRLWLLGGGDDEAIRDWLRRPRIEWGGKASPLQCLQVGMVGTVGAALASVDESEFGDREPS